MDTSRLALMRPSLGASKQSHDPHIVDLSELESVGFNVSRRQAARQRRQNSRDRPGRTHLHGRGNKVGSADRHIIKVSTSRECGVPDLRKAETATSPKAIDNVAGNQEVLESWLVQLPRLRGQTQTQSGLGVMQGFHRAVKPYFQRRKPLEPLDLYSA